MARKAKADSAETIEAIVSATRRVLEREGIHAISLRKVAREAGVSVGTLTYYFPSAEALWEACLDAHYERVRAFGLHYVARLQGEVPLHETLREAVRHGYSFALGEHGLLRLVMTQAVRRGGVSKLQQHDRARILQGLAGLWPSELPPQELVLRFQTIVFACVRYACASVEERMTITGAPTEKEADGVIAEHLASSAVLLLLPP